MLLIAIFMFLSKNSVIRGFGLVLLVIGIILVIYSD